MYPRLISILLNLGHTLDHLVLLIFAAAVAIASCSNGSNGSAGLDGKNTLAKTTTESVGSSNCATGGVKIEYGLDANNNGTLDAGEINAALTKYVCNGSIGSSGSNGSNGSQGPAESNGSNGSNGSQGATGGTGGTGTGGTGGIGVTGGTGGVGATGGTGGTGQTGGTGGTGTGGTGGAGETGRVATVLVQKGRMVIHAVLPVGVFAPARCHRGPRAVQEFARVDIHDIAMPRRIGLHAE